MADYTPDDQTPQENARLIKSLVTPRPIAWISTMGRDGTDNLAPYSSYNYVCAPNPVLMFSSGFYEGRQLKDTARNVLDTREFAVNVVSEPLAEQMDQTSKRLPADQSEFDLAFLKQAECSRISAPRVAEAEATMECVLYDSLRVYSQIVILGEVVYIHVSDDLLTDGEIDMRKVRTVGRLGGPLYTISEDMGLKRRHPSSLTRSDS